MSNLFYRFLGGRPFHFKNVKNDLVRTFAAATHEVVYTRIMHISSGPTGECVTLTAFSIFLPDDQDYC